jgi:hypothetical protein
MTARQWRFGGFSFPTRLSRLILSAFITRPLASYSLGKVSVAMKRSSRALMKSYPSHTHNVFFYSCMDQLVSPEVTEIVYIPTSGIPCHFT